MTSQEAFEEEFNISGKYQYLGDLLFLCWQAACKYQREQDAKLCELSTATLLLMSGEMMMLEARTVKAVLRNRADAIRSQE